MPDYSAKYTDRAILNIRRKLRISYAQARKEMEKQLEDFLRKYQAKDEKKRAQVEAGQISEAQYQRWLIGQVFMRKRRESKIRQLNETLEDANNQALNIINEKRLDVFAENYNFEAFQAEKHTGISFDIYNTQAVALLLKNHPQVLPKWKIDEEKDYKWNYQKSQRSIMQGIVQGKSIPQITKDLCRVLATQNENRMALFARTGITEAQNAGRIQQMKDAEDLGVEVKKQWLATLDSRTRDAHRQLDGQEKDIDEPFESDLGKIRFPGDPQAHPANVYNCRCTLISVYPKYRDIMQQNPERKAYGTYKDADGKEHRFNYLTRNPEGYAKWKQEKHKSKDKFTDGKNDSIIKPYRSMMMVELQQFAEKDLIKQTEKALRDGIENLKKRIEEHEKKIENIKQEPEVTGLEKKKRDGLIRFWEREIRNYKKSVENREEELKRRGL